MCGKSRFEKLGAAWKWFESYSTVLTWKFGGSVEYSPQDIIPRAPAAGPSLATGNLVRRIFKGLPAQDQSNYARLSFLQKHIFQ